MISKGSCDTEDWKFSFASQENITFEIIFK